MFLVPRARDELWRRLSRRALDPEHIAVERELLLERDLHVLRLPETVALALEEPVPAARARVEMGEMKAFLPSLVHLCLREAGPLGLCFDLVSCRFASLLRAKVTSQSR